MTLASRPPEAAPAGAGAGVGVGVSTGLRVALEAGWLLGAVAPGEDGPRDWRAIASPMPVAAALAEAGAWSLDADGPPRDFDAETWHYRLDFDAPADAAGDADTAEGPWVLGFDGLATLCEVWLNGERRLDSHGMFRRRCLRLPALRRRGNRLELRFRPLAAALAERRPRPRWRVPMLVQQQLRWFRTTLVGRTPGWSPAAAPVGPWRGVWLERRDRPGLVGCRVDARLDAVADVGRVQVRLRTVGPWPAGDRLRLRLGDRQVEACPHPAAAVAGAADAAAPARDPGADAAETDGTQAWEATLEWPAPARWWPHTHGEPVLYALERVPADGGAPQPLARVGFRQVVLDSTDGGCTLRVNGEAVFARGACWVPADALRLHAAPHAYAPLLAQVRAAGMNLLRVPGTMVYEHPAFYAACDAAGVMVWQDLMFASMDYPDDAAFAAEVAQEVAQQLDDWGGHASLAVVCGNSEVAQQAAMWGAPREAWSPPLFEQAIAAQVRAARPGLAWWPSSAQGGDFPFQVAQGSCSYYGVGAYRRPLDEAHAAGPRFATECLAFANVPDDATLARVPGLSLRSPVHAPAWKARVPRDLGAGWDFDDVRDHYAQALLGEPVEPLRASDPAHYLALARATSAEVIARSLAQWRRADSRCAGALVWTLRDFRAGAGWGLLDDRGRPKAAWHGFARAARPTHLALIDEGLDGLAAHAHHEGPDAIDGVLELRLYQHDEVPVGAGRVPLRVPARGRARVGLTQALGHFMDLNGAYRFGPRALSCAVARWWRSPAAADAAAAAAADGADAALALEPPLATACWFAPGGLSARRPEIGLAAHALPVDPAAPALRQVRIRTRAAAWGLYAESDGWRPRDEFGHLPPGDAVTWTFEPAEPPPPGGRLPAWRVVLRALNTHQAVVVAAPAGPEGSP